MDDVGSIVEPTSSLAWADVICADFQRVISLYIQNISTCLSCKAQGGLRTIFIQKSKPISISYYQNRRGFYQPILCPLWLMTSAAADVISVPSVLVGSLLFSIQCHFVCPVLYQNINRCMFNDFVLIVQLLYSSSDCLEALVWWKLFHGNWFLAGC